MLIKVCGMRYGENIRRVSALGIDYMGLVFYPASPRYVSQRPAFVPGTVDGIRLTGVFVDAPAEVIAEKVSEYSLAAVQLHGSETPGFCSLIRKKTGAEVIKALHVADMHDIEKGNIYAGCCDFLLLDTACSGYGGSGRSFDWGLLDCCNLRLPFFLSGGIDVSSAGRIAAIKNRQMAGIDINSRFEKAPGLKDIYLINELLNRLNNYGNQQNKGSF